MKRFIFKDELIKVNKTYGGATHLCTIYTLKNNELEKVGTCDYNTASTMGSISEVNQWLIDNKFITKKEVLKQSGKFSDNCNYYVSTSFCLKNDVKYSIKEV